MEAMVSLRASVKLRPERAPARVQSTAVCIGGVFAHFEMQQRKCAAVLTQRAAGKWLAWKRVCVKRGTFTGGKMLGSIMYSC